MADLSPAALDSLERLLRETRRGRYNYATDRTEVETLPICALAADTIAALRAQSAAARAGKAPCATEGCDGHAEVHFVRGGVGSDYCGECYRKVHVQEQRRLSALTTGGHDGR